MSQIIDQLNRDEGRRLHAYQDHLGYWTIGVGRLIDLRKGVGISPEEADYLLLNDVTRVRHELSKSLPWFVDLDDARQGALINMAFQLGTSGLMNFKKTLEHIRLGRYATAAGEMLQSKWAEQTPERAKRISKQMATGVWQ